MPYGVEVDGFLEDACLFYNEVALFTPIRDKQRLFLVLKKFQCKPKKRIVFRVSVVEKQIDNDKTILYETYQRSYGGGIVLQMISVKNMSWNWTKKHFRFQIPLLTS